MYSSEKLHVSSVNVYDKFLTKGLDIQSEKVS